MAGRVDGVDNVSKRLASGRFPSPLDGVPSRDAYGAIEAHYSIGLGCEMRYAGSRRSLSGIFDDWAQFAVMAL